MEAEDRRWVVTGAEGMLGTDLVDMLAARGASVVSHTRASMDVTDAEAVASAVEPGDIVVNCAAYTAVDAAEADVELAMQVNGHGAGNVAKACAAQGALMIHLSTDYVFAGDATEPYREDTPPAPLSAYGRSKAAGEAEVIASGAEHLLVRTGWLYGASGTCFPRTIARIARERGAVSVVADQFGQPTWTRDVVQYIVALVEAEAPSGTYHGTASGQTSWFEFAREVCLSAGLGDIVTPIRSSDYPQRARRPAWSVLGHDAHEALGIPSIGNWLERWRVAAPEVLG